MVRRFRESTLASQLGAALALSVVVALALATLVGVVSAKTQLPSLEGSWQAQVLEPGSNGLVEETRSFEITFGPNARFSSRTLAGEQGEGSYELLRGRLLRLQGHQEEVYSILPLNEKVLTIYREGSQKAIYLVRNEK